MFRFVHCVSLHISNFVQYHSDDLLMTKIRLVIKQQQNYDDNDRDVDDNDDEDNDDNDDDDNDNNNDDMNNDDDQPCRNGLSSPAHPLKASSLGLVLHLLRVIIIIILRIMMMVTITFLHC